MQVHYSFLASLRAGGGTLDGTAARGFAFSGVHNFHVLGYRRWSINLVLFSGALKDQVESAAR